MADQERIIGVAQSAWLALVDDGITLSQAGVGPAQPFRLDASTPPVARLNFTITYDLDAIVDPQAAHGILGVQFLDLDGPGESDTDTGGLRGPISITIRNDTDVPLGLPGPASDTALIFLADNQSDAVNYLQDPNPANQITVHALYAHFHGVPDSAGPLTLEQRSLTSPTPGTPGAPSTLGLHGQIAPHSSVTFDIATLHERDQQGIDDSFVLTVYPTTDFITAADFATLEAQWHALNDPPPGPGPAPAATDWDALGARVEQYFADTGAWGSLDDWLTPPPPAPDGGPMDYLIA
ncbi:hypothetical protein QWZ14_26205 [Paeniroseomonas aquatica]|uniref:CHRD domain-containing protein n=1 Tax=Paeniroseomonas aquatica TaxID=373043 RepID=A0ABT8ADW0_9PROT|nr:hypothetical protein [Paeniroseomonas aquatica]MDN3567888.1 hypothetical protein [Paeniroseomonas aquatica]